MSVAALMAAALLPASGALADGDPGSDVLVYQPLFLEADAGISLEQQTQLGALLAGARQAGFPIRVAIVATRYDLGAVTELWRQPKSYARFLDIEISQAYPGRLLVVMPNGLGFSWPGHGTRAAYEILSRIRIGSGGAGLVAATERAVTRLSAAAGVKLHLTTSSGTTPSAASPAPGSRSPAVSGSSADMEVAILTVALAAALGLALLGRRLLRRRLTTVWRGLKAGLRPRATIVACGGLVLAAAAAIAVAAVIRPGRAGPGAGLATNPNLDPGTPLKGVAPGFRLTDQFGHSISLSSFRGKVVLLAFNDSECTTICPLTTTAMLQAKAMLGRAGSRVQLLGVDANPKATALQDVQSYSELHGMLHAWHFLTGSLPELQKVWKAYGVQAAVQGGQIAHTPALFVIDTRGRLSRLFMTQQSYAAVGQEGQLLAEASSSLLPGHPQVRANKSYSEITGIGPSRTAALPRAGGGNIDLRPGQARVLLFFATWDRQITGLGAGLEGLSRYSAAARRDGLPSLTAVDEGSVEPPGALGRFIASLPHPLGYPVAIDRSGRVADGYEVEGLPWLMVVSPSGHIAWYYSVASLGWPTTARLVARVKEALARSSAAPGSRGATRAELAGSPPPLRSLHQQASQLLGGEAALESRIRALRGYPIVINAWASWCVPCREEFGLYAIASARYGRQVAFLGADSGDSAGDARSFLSQHPVSYPSYQTSTSSLDWLVPQGLAGLPTTIFVSPAGKLVYVHTGQYDSLGTLEADIQNYALDR